MSESPQQRILAQLAPLCKGRADAIHLIEDMLNLVEVWDDAVDKDHRESEEDINRAFLWALCGRDENEFLTSNPGLRLAMKQMVAVWIAANVMERSGDIEKIRTAYTLRCSPYLFIVSVVAAASGVREAAQAAAILFGEEHGDSYVDYVADHMEKANGLGKQGTEA